MKKFFKWLLFLSLALVISVAIIVYNPLLIKGPLESYLSRVAGHTISLDGALEIDLGNKLEITLTRVNISAPDWARQQNLVSVGYLKLALDSNTLFKETVVLDFLQVDDLQINLETATDGGSNWTSVQPKAETDTDSKGATRVVFNEVQLNEVKLHYFNGVDAIEHDLLIDSLNQRQQIDGMLGIELQGHYNSNPLTFTGSIGTYDDLLMGRNIAYSGDASFGLLKIKSSGLIDDIVRPRRPQFKLDVEGPDIDKITAAFGIDDLGSGAFSLNASGNEVNGQYEASIDGDIGDITLAVSAQASDLLDLNSLHLNIAANGPSLGAFTRTLGIDDWPDKPFNLKADVTRTGSTLNIPSLNLSIGGTNLTLDALLSNFPHLDASRVKISIVGDDIVQFRKLLGVPGVAHGPFKISGKLDVAPDAIELLQVNVETSLGQATLSGELGSSPRYLGTKLHLHVDGKNAHTVMSAFDVDALPDQPFSLDTRFEVVEQGIKIERGVLVTIADERLELGGLLTLNPGSVGTSLDVLLNGKHLNQMVRRLVGDTELPDKAYNLQGHIEILDDGVQLENIAAEFAGINLGLGGKIKWGDEPLSAGLDFNLSGNDLSALSQFELIGDSLDMLVPGQGYTASGRLSQQSQGWQFDKVKGQVGETSLNFDAMLSKQPDLTGSEIHFSLQGPGLPMLLRAQPDATLPPGAFKTNGTLSLSDSSLNVTDFSFETPETTGSLELELGWPFGQDVDARFDVNIKGNDVRHLLAANEVFKPDMLAYKINAIGRKQGKQISIKQADAKIGNLQLQLTGSIGENASNESAIIRFNIASPDISNLGLMHGERLPDMPFEFKADFEGNAQQFALDNIVGTLGDSQISAKLDVALDGEKPNIKLTANSRYIDFRPFIDDSDAAVEPSATDNNERLIPPTPLPLDALAAADVSINLSIAELEHSKNILKNITLGAVTNSGELNVETLNFEGPRGTVEASFSILPTSGNLADVQINLVADNLILNLSDQNTEMLDQAPKVDIRLHATGSGSNLQEIAGSTNGSLALGSRGGVLQGVNLSILDTFILDEIFKLVLPKTDVKDDLLLTCAAAKLKITDGMINTEPAVAVTTSLITLVSKGTVDLKTEKIKINFNATPNNALKLSASELFNPYILVSGTLNKPSVGLDPQKVILQGGVALGTAGISVLAKGLLDRVSTNKPLCEDMLESIHPSK